METVSDVPAGAWAVAVSGGADSVALLHLLRQRSDLDLTVVHLNHQTRGTESDGDANFVKNLGDKLNIACHIATLAEIEPRVRDLPANPSAKYRKLRFALFRDVIEARQLAGVILAHHADDLAETVLQRLLRGSGYSALAGMSPRATIHGITVLRPLLRTRRAELRKFLADNKFIWREDSSNQSPTYLRNRLRAILNDDLTAKLIDLADACAMLKTFVGTNAPKLAAEFPAAKLADLPTIFARRSASRWLRERGVPDGEIDRRVIDRLLEMNADAASANRQQFPGGITVRRAGGKILAAK